MDHKDHSFNNSFSYTDSNSIEDLMEEPQSQNITTGTKKNNQKQNMTYRYHKPK